jgi:hypothetical protein
LHKFHFQGGILFILSNASFEQMKTEQIKALCACIIVFALAIIAYVIYQNVVSYGKQNRQKHEEIRNFPPVIRTPTESKLSIRSETAIQSNAQLSPSLVEAVNARTQSQLATAAAMGAEEARAAAREGGTEVNQYGVSKADVAAARAESLKWMTEHCDARRGGCKLD